MSQEVSLDLQSRIRKIAGNLDNWITHSNPATMSRTIDSEIAPWLDSLVGQKIECSDTRFLTLREGVSSSTKILLSVVPALHWHDSKGKTLAAQALQKIPTLQVSTTTLAYAATVGYMLAAKVEPEEVSHLHTELFRFDPDHKVMSSIRAGNFLRSAMSCETLNCATADVELLAKSLSLAGRDIDFAQAIVHARCKSVFDRQTSTPLSYRDMYTPDRRELAFIAPILQEIVSFHLTRNTQETVQHNLIDLCSYVQAANAVFAAGWQYGSGDDAKLLEVVKSTHDLATQYIGSCQKLVMPRASLG